MPRKIKLVSPDIAAPNPSTSPAPAPAPDPAPGPGPGNGPSHSPTHPVAAPIHAANAAPAVEAPVSPADRQAGPASADPNAPGGDKGWVKPYETLFVSKESGFEMGENRRFKQRVFIFKEKPPEDVRKILKDHGFVYRPAEKSWTVPATFANRVITDRLARELAGNEAGIG